MSHCLAAASGLDGRVAPVDQAMDRFAAGDDGAFVLVYTACARPVFRALARLTREPMVAEDLTQETMLRMYCARSTWRAGASVLPWARAIARRLFLDRTRHARCEEAAHELLSRSCAAEDTERADAHLAARRMAEVASATIERLPAGQREAFLLVEGEGLSLAEVSARLGDTSLAVRIRVHRARRAIHAALAGH